jgi:hypothetical protein
MRKKTFTMRPIAKPKWKESGKSVEEIVTKLQKSVPQSPYREQSLRIHGLICAKCAREFDYTDRHLLTIRLTVPTGKIFVSTAMTTNIREACWVTISAKGKENKNPFFPLRLESLCRVRIVTLSK